MRGVLAASQHARLRAHRPAGHWGEEGRLQRAQRHCRRHRAHGRERDRGLQAAEERAPLQPVVGHLDRGLAVAGLRCARHQHRKRCEPPSPRERAANRITPMTTATTSSVDLLPRHRALARDLARLAVDEEAVDLVAVAVGGDPHRQQHVLELHVAVAAWRRRCTRCWSPPMSRRIEVVHLRVDLLPSRSGSPRAGRPGRPRRESRSRTPAGRARGPSGSTAVAAPRSVGGQRVRRHHQHVVVEALDVARGRRPARVLHPPRLRDRCGPASRVVVTVSSCSSRRRARRW